MLWVRFFWASKTYAQNNGLENIYNFTLKMFVYLRLWLSEHFAGMRTVWKK